MQDTRRDHGLKVTGEGKLLVGHAGTVLLRKLADPRTPDKIAWVRAKVRAHIWSLIAARPAGFPWLEVATGWRYSIIVTNIPAAHGIGGVPGSHRAQFIDVLHRQHAVVEDGVRTAKSMGLRNLPSKTWVVNCGWVLAANLTADLAWCRLLGLYDRTDLKLGV